MPSIRARCVNGVPRLEWTEADLLPWKPAVRCCCGCQAPRRRRAQWGPVRTAQELKTVKSDDFFSRFTYLVRVCIDEHRRPLELEVASLMNGPVAQVHSDI